MHGHDEHFLSRLARAEAGQVELALSLYQDTDLVRHVLEEARAAQGAERVALCLDDAGPGPYLLVARNGRFVTCLGAGMEVKDAPVVPRSQLDAIARRLERLRDRVEVARALVGPGDHTRELLRSLFEAGPYLSREQFMALASLEPVLGLLFWGQYFHTTAALARARPALLLRDVHPPPDILRIYWEQVWALGPLSVLGSMSGRAHLARPEAARLLEQPLFTLASMEERLAALAMRAAWGVGQVGKPALAGYKRALQQATTMSTFLDAVLALLVLGLRHAALKAEVHKALVLKADPSSLQGMRRALRLQAGGLAHTLERPEQVLQVHRQMGASLALQFVGPALGLERQEDVPDDLAYPLLLGHLGDPTIHSRTGEACLYSTAYLARAQPEELFLPEKYQRLLRRPWQPADALVLLGHWDRRPQPVRASPTPGPNQPCACGSGLKYKRCCAA